MSRACLYLAVVLAAVIAVSAAAPARADDGSSTNWGLGLGIPYGVVGVNLEAGQQTRLSVGVGTALVGVGWNVGVKHYFKPLTAEEGSMSVSAYYGVNAIVDHESGFGDDETLQGFSIGLGWTKGHFDIGLIYPFADPEDEEQPGEDLEEIGTPIKIYIGYRF